MTNGNDAINVIMHPVSGEVENAGLTKREYFAAMAPSIPDWFKHDEPARINNLPDWQKIENDEDIEIVRQWVADGFFDLPEHLMWFQIATDLAQKDYKRWIIENNISRYFQWRTFYADYLIAELNKPTT